MTMMMMMMMQSVHFSKKSACQSSAGPEILAYVNHCSAKFQLILDCIMPNFKVVRTKKSKIFLSNMRELFEMNRMSHFPPFYEEFFPVET